MKPYGETIEMEAFQQCLRVTQFVFPRGNCVTCVKKFILLVSWEVESLIDLLFCVC